MDVKVPCPCVIRLTSHFFTHCLFNYLLQVLSYFGFQSIFGAGAKASSRRSNVQCLRHLVLLPVHVTARARRAQPELGGVRQ